jgi:hypothetical protein
MVTRHSEAVEAFGVEVRASTENASRSRGLSRV